MIQQARQKRAAIMLLFSIFLATAPVAAQTAQPAPNVILIVTDDLGWGDLGAYGHPVAKTPNIDALARRGSLFTGFYQASPVCSPSRAAMVTARYPAELGIHYAIGGGAGRRYNSPQQLDPDLPTIYDRFQAAGYRTGHFGKWHMGDRQTAAAMQRAAAGSSPAPITPAAYGLDESGVTNGMGPPLRTASGQMPERHESSAAIVDAGIAFIQRAAGKPFFLSLWTLEPHSVLLPSDEQLADYLDLTDPGARARGWVSSQTVYYASLANIDRQLGRLFAHLEAAGLARDTIIVFTSDNGPSPLWSLATGHAGAGLAGPFRGVKGSLYEGGTRVPFIVAWPGRVPAGRIDDDSVIGGVDLMPTLAALAGVPAPTVEGQDGEDMSAALLGARQARSKPLMWEYRFGSWGRHIDKSPRLAMRDGPWKLLLNPDGSRIELFHLGEDPSETGNRAAFEPDRVKAMQAQLTQWWQTAVRDPDNAPRTSGSNAYPWPGTGRTEADVVSPPAKAPRTRGKR